MRLTFPYSNEQFQVDVDDPTKGTKWMMVPWVPIRLFRGKTSTAPFTVLVDSGADHAIFKATVAPEIGIADYTTGDKETMVGIGKSTLWMHHDINLAIRDKAGNKVGMKLNKVGFAPELPVAGLVGRASFFEAFLITFDHPAETIHLDLIDGAANLIDWADVPIYKPPIPARKRGYKQNR